MSTNAVLKDIEQIEVARPELTADQWETVNKASDYIKSLVRPEVRSELEIEFIKRQQEDLEQLRLETQAQVSKEMDQWRKDQKPLDKEELTTLLSQDYLDYPVKIKVRGQDVIRTFTISELPSFIEMKFLEEAKKHLIPLIEAFASSEWSLTNSVKDKLQAVLDRSPTALQVAGDLAAICLNPWGEDTEINGDWVMRNLSSVRIGNILIAQSEANRYRDFFLKGSRLFRN